MNRWHPFDPEKFFMTKFEGEKGVSIKVSLSPFDVPDAVRGNYDERLKRFIIEFRYIQDEPWARMDAGEHVAFRIGRTSHRLYGIELDADGLNVEEVSLVLNKAQGAMERVAERQPRAVRTENMKALKDIVGGQSRNILSGLLSSLNVSGEARSGA